VCVAVGCALVLALLAADAPSALANAVFSVQPAKRSQSGYFILAATPGAMVRSSVEVLNVGDKPGSASVYSVDGTTGQTSGAVYRSREERRKDVGSWIRLSKTKVTLAPNAHETIPFTVRVRAGAFAGAHLGGIVVQAFTLTSRKILRKTKRSSFQVEIRELSIVAVEVNVPGARVIKLAITGMHASGIPGHQSLLIGLSNPGNVFVKGRGSLSVVDSSGKQVERRNFLLDTLVSHTHISYPVYTAGKSLPNGSYKGTVAVIYRNRHLVHLVRSFRFKIAAANQKQVFGAPPGAAPDPSPSPDDTLLYIPLGAAVVLLAAITFGLGLHLRGERRN
jgi:Bacterial protein of unknown function (DUF916)